MLLPTIASPLWEGPLVGTHEFSTGQNEDLPETSCNIKEWSKFGPLESFHLNGSKLNYSLAVRGKREHILGNPKAPTRYPVVANTLTHYPKDRCCLMWFFLGVIGVLSNIFPSFLRQFHPFVPEIPHQPSHEGRDGPLKPVATNSALLVQSWGLEEVRLGQCL